MELHISRETAKGSLQTCANSSGQTLKTGLKAAFAPPYFALSQTPMGSPDHAKTKLALQGPTGLSATTVSIINAQTLTL